MADLLALQLHRAEDDVRRIVDKAVKELGTEKVVSLGWVVSTWLILGICIEANLEKSPFDVLGAWRDESHFVPCCSLGVG